MSPQEFKNLWTIHENNLTVVKVDDLLGFKLLPGTLEFLSVSGLPDSAAPFLSFLDGEFGAMEKLWELDEPVFRKYFVIGSCSNGDPIVINTEVNDQIELIEHDKNFNSVFFNTSIEALAECLLAYKQFVFRAQHECGEDALLEGNFTDEQYGQLQRNILAIDNSISTKGGFWKEQFEMDLANREYYQNEKLNK